MKIDNRKRFVTVLDTETTGLDDIPGLAFPLIYDIRWILADKNGNKLIEREFIVQEIFYNPIMKNAYYGDKIPAYVARVTKADILVKPFREILALLEHDFNLVKHNTLMAYNIAFDLRALRSTAIYCGILERGEKDWTKLFSKPMPIQDIWSLAVETILRKKWDYITFIDENGFFTETGNPKTSAEIVYRFLTGETDYQEHHTALEDCKIEYDIAITALRTKKPFTEGILYNPWRIISKLYNEYLEYREE